MIAHREVTRKLSVDPKNYKFNLIGIFAGKPAVFHVWFYEKVLNIGPREMLSLDSQKPYLASVPLM